MGMESKQSNVSRAVINLYGSISTFCKFSWFEPSSVVKVELYRGYRHGNILKVLVGKYEGKVVDLLENGELLPMFANVCQIHAEDGLLDTSFQLTDKEGILAAKMKIALSPISGSGDDNIEEFMKKVDDNVNLMSSLPSNLSTLSTLGQVLKLIKTIMDQFSQVVYLSSLNLIIVNRLIEEIRYTRYSMDRGPLFPVFTR